jgi:hypothetical protein
LDGGGVFTAEAQRIAYILGSQNLKVKNQKELFDYSVRLPV